MVIGPFRFSHGSARCYVSGRRVHHGAVGAVLTALGAILMAHDRRDWPWRLRDL